MMDKWKIKVGEKKMEKSRRGGGIMEKKGVDHGKK